MQPDQKPAWDRVSAVLEEALDLPPSERAAFLDRACNGDPALRAEVESLLAHEVGASRALDRAVGNQLAGYAAEGSIAPGDRLGPYEIQRLVGQGGMGAVYEAVRADDQFRQRVAIKVVKRGMDTDFVLARFRQERQILANLRHPNVAHLLDGGSTLDGRPYLVMEFVEGAPVTAYCADRSLPAAARLRLFLGVCAAVQAAHAALVVHRDLKPSNILVTAEGQPKLLDFGIAKLLDPASVEESAALTRTSMRLLTPEYASPEQVRGEPVTTATDIYSLGAILYELLTGQPAHGKGGSDHSGWERRILEQEPVKPSTAARGREMAALLRGDIDNIVLRALNKEPERRYSTVLELAADIENYLDERPVSARPDTIAYRARKFVRRNRLTVVVAALGAIGLVGGAAAALYQARQARLNAEQANRRFEQVRQLARTLLFDVHDEIQALPGSANAREKIVTTSLSYLDNLSKEAGDDTELMSEMSQAYQRVALIQGAQFRANLGKDARARESFSKAIALGESVLARKPGDAAELARMARLYVNLSDNLAKAGEDERVPLSKAIAMAERLAPLAGVKPELNGVLSYVHGHAYQRNIVRDYAAAARHAQQALEFARKVHAHDSKAGASSLTLALSRAGRVQYRNGFPARAIEHYEQASALYREILAAKPSTTLRRSLALNYLQHARSLASPLHPDGPNRKAAYAKVSEALDIVRELERTDTGNVLRLFDRSTMEMEAVLLMGYLDPPRAYRHKEMGLRAIHEYLRLVPNHAEAQDSPAGYEEAIAVADYATGRYAHAARALSTYMARRRGARPLENCDILARRAIARIKAGDLAGAAADSRQAAEIFESTDFAKEMADYLATFTMSEAQIEWVEERLAATGAGPTHVEAARRARDRWLKLIAELKKRGVWTKYLEGWKADG